MGIGQQFGSCILLPKLNTSCVDLLVVVCQIGKDSFQKELTVILNAIFVHKFMKMNGTSLSHVKNPNKFG